MRPHLSHRRAPAPRALRRAQGAGRALRDRPRRRVGVQRSGGRRWGPATRSRAIPSLTRSRSARSTTTRSAPEIAESRARLSDASGAEVIGFRAPAWDVTGRVLEVVAASGYRYDASVFPTPVLVASRLAAYRRSTHKGSIFSMDRLRTRVRADRPASHVGRNTWSSFRSR